MTPQRSLESLSATELRRLLVEKRRSERLKRLEQFRRTGRVILVEPSPAPLMLDEMRRAPLLDNEEPLQPKPKKGSQVFLNRLLLLVEIGAVVGLLAILLSGFTSLRNLNQQVVAVLQQPTLVPTALIQAVVLPGGHMPPNASGEVVVNEAEIPEHLRPIVQAMANLPIPTPGAEQAMRIQIPVLGVDAPVVQGDGLEQLKKGVGQHIGTPNPGQKGNLVLSAHDDVYGEIFRNLDQLKAGDQVILFTNQRTYTYVVRQTQEVEPTRVDLMAPTRDAAVTLISCYPYMVDNQRIVVTASLQE